VLIDPVPDRIVGTRTEQVMCVGERIVHTVDQLHFGTFCGFATRLIGALFGFLMLT
jgi:uncharacterized iron-regulated membrane protein